MKNKIGLFLVLLINQLSFGVIIPIFDLNEDLWLTKIGDIVQISSPFDLGLANLDDGFVIFSFHFFEIEGNLVFNPPPIPSNLFITYSSNYFSIYGLHNGPGNIIEDIIITGYGLINIYESLIFLEYNCVSYIGSVNVIPEPSTFFFVLLGIIFIRRKKYARS